MTYSTRRRIAISVAAVAVGIGGTLAVQRVLAAGVPTTATLTYSGELALPDGTAVEGKRNIGLALYDAVTAGKRVCDVVSAEVDVVRGRFQIPLVQACADAVKATPDLWVDVQVDGASIGRTKLGAVPYALEAGHALRADQASRATGSLAGMWVVSPTDGCASIPANSPWIDIPGESITFQVDAPVRLLSMFSLNASPDAAAGSAYVGVRLVLDGSTVPGGGDHYQPYSSADSNAALHAMSVGDVAAGTHTLKLQWFTAGGSTVSWTSCMWAESGLNSQIGARTLVAQAFYK